MATIQDIARISGYSIGTVSRVINNRDGVSDEARQKIEEVIREQNYQPNSSARLLRQSVSSEISIVVRGISNIFLQSLLEKVQLRIREHGEVANVQFIREIDDEVAMAAQIVQSLKPKGVIFLGGSMQSFQEEFSTITVPSVLISSDASELGYANLSSFTTDDADAAAFATCALISRGHRRVGILGGYPGDTEGMSSRDSSALRIQGAVGELEKNGIAFDFERDYEGSSFSTKGGYQAAERLLTRTPDLTAIFAISDSIALGAMRAFRDMGMHVPQDISVVGFDGIMVSEYSIPRLATVQQDTEELARKGVEDLLMRISYDRLPVHEKIPYQFVDGESIAQPR